MLDALNNFIITSYENQILNYRGTNSKGLITNIDIILGLLSCTPKQDPNLQWMERKIWNVRFNINLCMIVKKAQYFTPLYFLFCIAYFSSLPLLSIHRPSCEFFLLPPFFVKAQIKLCLHECDEQYSLIYRVYAKYLIKTVQFIEKIQGENENH